MDEDILKQDKILLDSSSTAATTTQTVGGDGAATKTAPFAGKPKRIFHPVKTLEERRAEKAARRKRDARIIVRNLSFKCNDTNLREHFAKFGTIVDLNVLKRSDGKLVGCAFVQYEQVNQAAKAIKHCSGKDLLGRPVYVDFAVNKTEHKKHERAKKQTSSAGGAKTGAAVEKPDAERNPEDSSDDDDGGGAVDDDKEVSIKSEPDSDGDDDADENDDDDNASDDDADDDDEDDKKDIKPLIKSEGDDSDVDSDADADEKPKRKQTGKDVLVEGCTVFIRNIPFDATERDFAACARQFGHIHYARITMDPKSGHSKGTGFVKFRSRESAEMCLQAGTEFKLLGQVLDPLPFCTKDAITKRHDEAKAKNPADSRNLYLTKEGMITAGSPAAEGVSVSDMAKRLHLERTKAELLKNLNKFVSRVRLIVHNIPPTYDSAKLCTAVKQHAKLKPKNWRVERENQPSPGHPQGKSKGFGFLDFDTHEDALLCLRRLNNNPLVFGQNNRPIVSFSLEDKSVHNLKQKRLERSLEKNPTFLAKKERRLQRRKEARQQKLALLSGTPLPSTPKTTSKSGTTDGTTAAAAAAATEDATAETDENKPRGKSMRRKAHKAKLKLLNRQKKAAKLAPPVTPAPDNASFAGVLAEPGTGSTRPRWKLAQQSETHAQGVAVQKRDARKEREKRELQKEKKEVDRTKKRQKSGNEVDNFSFLVDKYKQLIDSSNAADQTKADGVPAKRAKWYADE